jgi:hypothetical protein
MRDRDQFVLDAIGSRKPNIRGYVRANCPFCVDVVHKTDRKQCLSLDTKSGWWSCFRCSSKGKLEESLFGSVMPLPADAPPAPPVNLPDGYAPLWGSVWHKSLKPAHRYLKSRNVDMPMIEAAKIGACARGPFAGRIVVPIYKGGKLAGYVGRIWTQKGAFKYRYSEGFARADTLYNEEALYVTSDEPVILVEGVFDTFPFWPRGVAVLGKASDGQGDMLRAARRPILIVMDGDAHREATALAMHLRLAGKRAAALQLPPGVDPDEAVDFVLEGAKRAFPPPE